MKGPLGRAIPFPTAQLTISPIVLHQARPMADRTTASKKQSGNNKKASSSKSLKQPARTQTKISSKSQKASNMAATTPSSSTTDKAAGNAPVYFWRPHEPHGYLSQWYESEFTVNGETFATAEMWMMVGKARLFYDEDSAKQMFACPDNPKRHKDLGRLVQNFDQNWWNKNKMQIVTDGTYHKFTKSENADELRAQLLATGDRQLVESSPFDRVWGIGFVHSNAEKNRYRWGSNLLGIALMQVRERLREEERKAPVIKK